MKNVIIVSTGDRCAYIAHQLQTNGIQTTILDVSALLPPVLSADQEGPFGVFVPPELEDLQKQYLWGDNDYQVHQGFSVLTAKGPIEFQGNLSGLLKNITDTFNICHNISSSKKSHFNNLSPQNQKYYWLWHLATELTNNYQNCVVKKNTPLTKKSPLFADYILRESSKNHMVNIKYLLQKQGVKWIDITSKKLINNVFNKDLQNNNVITNLDLAKNPIEVTVNNQKKSYQHLIWALSGPETIKCFPEKMLFLFPNWTKPVKIWKRFSLSWNQEKYNHIIPALLLIVPNNRQKKGIYQDFLNTEENILSLKKHPSASSTDLWILCPYAQRSNKAVLQNYLHSALKQLRVVFPGFYIEGSVLSDVSNQNYFVLYKDKYIFQKKLLQTKSSQNIYFLNPESTHKIDAYSMMEQSHKIFKSIL